jgi:hypothetical protein
MFYINLLKLPNNLDGYMLVGFMIQCTDDLPKAAFTYYLKDFVPVGYVVMENLGIEIK